MGLAGGDEASDKPQFINCAMGLRFLVLGDGQHRAVSGLGRLHEESFHTHRRAAKNARGKDKE